MPLVLRLCRAAAGRAVRGLSGAAAPPPLVAYLRADGAPGRFLPPSECRVSVEDRGFLFADGLYEVTKSFGGGRLFTERAHLARLARGLAELRFGDAAARAALLAEVRDAQREALVRSGLAGAGQRATVYTQVTRGSAPRAHAFPGSGAAGAFRANVFVVAKPFAEPSEATLRAGVAAVTARDLRWARCDLKTVGLLPNVLANQRAKERGAYECLLLRGAGAGADSGGAGSGGGGGASGSDTGSSAGVSSGGPDASIVEASHSNVFAVLDGRQLVTPALADNILPGITRDVIMRRAASLGLPAPLEGAISLREVLRGAKGRVTELFVTATTTEVMPIVTVDGAAVGSGSVGPVARALREAWPRWVAAEDAADDAAEAAGAAAAAAAAAAKH